MNQTERQRAIVDLIRDQDVTRVTELAGRLGVSDETIRRNVKALVESGMLTRSHGGVGLADEDVEPPFRRRLRVNAAEKRALAALVASRVEDDQLVMIDTGSTTVFVAQALATKKRLTVVTNSIEIARHLVGRNQNRIYMAGGEISPELAAAVGAEAEAFIGRFHADVAILSIGGVEPRSGFTDFDLDEARIARAMIERADFRIVAADATKFSRRAAVSVCGTSEIDAVATSAPPAAEVAAWLTEGEVEILAPATAVAGDEA